MRPGPTFLRQCSKCPQIIQEPTLFSGNTFDARYWTDGKRDAPMLPDYPWLVECPNCRALLWSDELEKVGEMIDWIDCDEPGGSQPYNIPSFKAYLAMLDQDIPDPTKERYLRIRVWWSGNDARRDSDVKQPLSTDEVDNLTASAVLMDETDENDRLIKAEIMRELGQFDAASKLLEWQFDEKLSKAAATIRYLVVKRDSYVSELKSE